MQLQLPITRRTFSFPRCNLSEELSSASPAVFTRSHRLTTGSPLYNALARRSGFKLLYQSFPAARRIPLGLGPSEECSSASPSLSHRLAAARRRSRLPSTKCTHSPRSLNCRDGWWLEVDVSRNFIPSVAWSVSNIVHNTLVSTSNPSLLSTLDHQKINRLADISFSFPMTFHHHRLYFLSSITGLNLFFVGARKNRHPWALYGDCLYSFFIHRARPQFLCDNYPLLKNDLPGFQRVKPKSFATT